MKSSLNKKGFTILELLVVVAIIAIIAVIALPNFIGKIDKAKDSRELAEINAVEKAVSNYYVDNGVYPTLQGKDGTLMQPQPVLGSPHNIDFSSLVPNYLATLPHFSYWWVDEKGDVFHTQKPLGSVTGGVFTPTVGYTYTLYKTNGTSQVLSAQYTLQAGEYVIGKDDKGVELPKVGSAFKNAKVHPESGESSGPDGIVPGTLTFTNATAVGRVGPTQSQVTTAYAGTELASKVTVVGSGMQLWTVPCSGTYRIEAYGAEGGAYLGGYVGGKGAIMKGEFALSKDEQLLILVGQQAPFDGSSYHGGGGGGTFVTKGNSYATATPLIVAGGGGGAYGGGTVPNGVSASITTKAQDSLAWTYTVLGGDNGQGGNSVYQAYSAYSSTSSGGGGFLTDGKTGTVYTYNPTGYAFRNGGLGGYQYAYNTNTITGVGGFGGGGGSHQGANAAGGGGGYSGGSGAGGGYSATGGGSYNIGTNQTNTVGNTGMGKVVVTYVGP